MPVKMQIGGKMPRPGSILRFGYYPFADTPHDYTPVEWVVLASRVNGILLLSRYALDVLPEEEIRPGERLSAAAKRWMNKTLFKRMFSVEERKRALPESPFEISLDPEKNRNRFFLFTRCDVDLYLTDRSLARAPLTYYAAWKGAFASEEKTEAGLPYGRWLLNDNGDPEWETVLFDENGALTRVNGPVKKVALRPAFWLDWQHAQYREGPNEPGPKYRNVLLKDDILLSDFR